LPTASASRVNSAVVAACAAPAVGTREVRFTDPRFVHTSGCPQSVMPGGDAVYLQATA